MTGLQILPFWINGEEIATMTIPGDFGGRRGRLNPEWWGDTLTQYGLYKEVRITDTGCYENDMKCSNLTLKDLELDKKIVSALAGRKA